MISVSENGTEYKDRVRAVSSGNSGLPESYAIPDTIAETDPTYSLWEQ